MSQFKIYFPVSEVIHAISKVAASTNLSSKTPSEEYYYYNVLEMSEGMEEMGGVNWKLCGCLLLSWIIVLVCLIRGISSLGKVRAPLFLRGVIVASLHGASRKGCRCCFVRMTQTLRLMSVAILHYLNLLVTANVTDKKVKKRHSLTS